MTVQLFSHKRWVSSHAMHVRTVILCHGQEMPAQAGGTADCSRSQFGISNLIVFVLFVQAHSYNEATSTPFGWYIKNAQTRALSHPLPVLRAQEVDTWAASGQYRALLAKNHLHRQRLPQKQ